MAKEELQTNKLSIPTQPVNKTIKKDKIFLHYPGRLFLRLFVSTNHSGAGENALTKTVLLSTRFTGYAITILFMLLFVFDLADLVYAQTEEKDPAYGRINPIIAMIGFASSQTAFFRAAATCIFTILHAKDMIQCYQFVMNGTENFQIPRHQRARHAKKANLLFLIVELSCVIRLILVMFETWDNLFQMVPYGFFSLQRWQINLHIFGCVILASSINLPLLTLFYYLCASLNDSAGILAADMQVLLDDPTQSVSPTTDYTNRLRLLRGRYEALCSMFERMQETFSAKLLIDTVGNIFELLIVVAWFCSWVALPSLGNRYKTGRMIMTVLGAILRLIYLVEQPLKFSHMPNRLSELMDEALCQRQAQRQKHTVSMAEVDISQTLDRKLKSSSLTFSAGQTLDVDRATVISVILSMTGYVCFIIERIEGYAIINSKRTS